MSTLDAAVGICPYCAEKIFEPYSDHAFSKCLKYHSSFKNYERFLNSKITKPETYGHRPESIHPVLYDFQAAITEWAIKRGRAAIFADCGMGKTLMQLEWARHSGPRVLIVAPLSVADQTIEEARKLSLEVVKVSDPIKRNCIQITNYQKLHRFLGAEYDAIVLDESSILKSLDGKTRTMLLREFTHIPRRLCCTATPAPNDLSEIANHAEFLGIMPRNEMLAAFFVHDSDGKAAGGWRLKGHAQDAFWLWMAKWAVYLRKPSDLGFEDNGFILPDLLIHQRLVQSDWRPEGRLFVGSVGGIQERRQARRNSIEDRISMVDMVWLER